ncbi:MAG: DEAD/DEAH box helicase family protein, partial [Patescibacteria group bacterium]
MFSLTAQFKPTGDQPEAIQSLVSGVKQNLKDQVLVGVTGSGKTFTMANVIQELQMPALIISHNKTLAGQLYQEMREFFPKNAISYFVSYYDYYQPEAYIPQTDTYIEKEAEINELIDKLRLRSTANILTRKDVVVVASVSCIYNIGAPQEYRKFTHTIKLGEASDWQAISLRFVELLYSRSEFEFKRGTFRVRGNYMDIYPPYEDHAVRLTSTENLITDITIFDPLTGRQIQSKESLEDGVIFYPAKHYLADPVAVKSAEKQIRHDLQVEHAKLKDAGKIIEAERLLRRTNYDLEMIKELGYVNGIENYSRYFDKREPG